MPISSKTTVAQSAFRKFVHTQPIEFPLILLTTHTNIGKLKVARPFLKQPNVGKLRSMIWVQFRATARLRTLLFQVLSKTANRISWILLTTHTNLGKFTVASPLSHKL